MLPCVCSVVDHRRWQNVVKTSVTYFTTIKFLSPFNIICHLLLNRHTATQNLLVHQNNAQAQCTWDVYWAGHGTEVVSPIGSTLTSITNILAHRSLWFFEGSHQFINVFLFCVLLSHQFLHPCINFISQISYVTSSSKTTTFFPFRRFWLSMTAVWS